MITIFDHHIAKTGSIVLLSKQFAEHNKHKWPGEIFWYGKFKINVIPQPCKGEEVKEYRVEFFQTPADSKTGFALKLLPNNIMSHPEPGLEDIEVIGQVFPG